MDFSLGQYTQLKQQQILSPQMLQSLALLPMSILELKEHVQQQIEENPALSIPDTEFSSQPDTPKPSSEDKLGDRDRLDDEDSSYYENISYSGDPDASDRKAQLIENSSSSGESLFEHLSVQLGETVCTEEEREAAELLIGNLDQNGFFIVDLDTLFENTRFSVSVREKAIELVQGFDPEGICVRDFRESLMLQARLSGMQEEDLEVFRKLVYENLEKLKSPKESGIAHSLGISEQELAVFVETLKSFSPYPGSIYSNECQNYVEPEFSIHNEKGTLMLEMNRTSIPNLEISSEFSELANELSGPEAKETATYISSRIREAKDLIKQVDMRFKTMYDAALAIIELQSEFFFKGPRYLKVMTLKDVADRIGVHETTVSRLAQSKWVETDWGLFQLKYFFSQGVGSTSSDGSQKELSRNAVKSIIQEIISEFGQISDQKISDKLLEKGIKCARRTVSKYRSELNIESSYSR